MPDRQDAEEWLEQATHGNFEAAWRVSDRIAARLGSTVAAHLPRHVQRIWNGADFHGQRVLIRCYHGLGDTIQFIRYAPLVRARAREVIVWAQPELLPLVATARGVDRLLPLHDGTPDVAFDVDVEVMELPYAFRTTLATIPNEVPYLSARPVQHGDARPRVGIAWRGGTWDSRRAIPFDRVRSLLDVEEVSWYCLQHPADPQERHLNLHPLDCRLLQNTAHYTASMDLVITIDSMLAHLAGALGVPVWTLLSYDADWRWMRGRTDSPWYPTMRLFRQARAGDWDAIVAEARHRLASCRDELVTRK